jgi:hypothetical protein
MHLTLPYSSSTPDTPPHILTVTVAAAARSTVRFCCYISTPLFCYIFLSNILFF